MRAIYLGKNKASAINGLHFLAESGIDIVVVVGPEELSPIDSERLIDVAHEYGIPTASDTDLYRVLNDPSSLPELKLNLESIDLVISYLFWKRIKKPLIELPSIGCLNFHPAPLPDFRGVGGYNFAIYESHTEWGVSAHYVDESFDTGDIIKVRRFDIEPQNETAYSLEQRSQTELLALFSEIINMCIAKQDLPRVQQSNGRYITQEEFESLKRITPDNSLDEIERKIRACWYPPYEGALVDLQGIEFTIVNRKLLDEIGEKYHKKL